MKKVICVGLLGVTVLTILFLIPKHSLAQRELVIYSYGGRWDEFNRKATADIIEKKFNCTVKMVPGLTAANVAKLAAAKANPEADLIYLDDIAMAQAIGSEVIDPFPEKDVPNLKNVYPNARKFGDYGVAMMFFRCGITVNSEKVKDPITSWEDLWNPKYKGHVAVMRLEGSFGVYALMAANKIAGGSDKDFTPGFNKIKELVPSLITTANSDRHFEQLFTQSDCWLAPWSDGRTAELAKRDFPVKFVSPKEGPFGAATYINLVKKSKNRDLALAYINQSLEPSSQVVFASTTFYGPTNQNTKLPPDIASLVTYGKEAVASIQFADSELVARLRSQWLERWNKEIKK